MIFKAEKLPRDFVFNFPGNVEEQYIKVESGNIIHGLHFRIEKPKGVIMYFHGNAGSLSGWGQWASVFQNLDYDVFMYDYSGYGKSTGNIHNEAQLHSEAREVYEYIIPEYKNKRIVFYGRSLGTGIAAKLATEHEPSALILCTPYFNFKQVVNFIYPYLPIALLLKYKLETNQYLKKITCPIYLLHGTEDELVPYQSSLMLKDLGSNIELTTIEGARHSDLIIHPKFKEKLKAILE